MKVKTVPAQVLPTLPGCILLQRRGGMSVGPAGKPVSFLGRKAIIAVEAAPVFGHNTLKPG